MLYLASTSPRRKKLLRDLKIPFKTIKPEYLENDEIGQKPLSMVRAHALGKALSGAKRVKEGTVLSADTTVFFQGDIIAKPRDHRHAFQILKSLQGKWHTVYTGVAVLSVKNGKVIRRRVFVEKTRILLKKMTFSEIKAYFKKIDPLDKAGAYAIQVKSNNIVEKIQGSFSNAVGLPMERIVKILSE